jgi:hypothetical protein
MKRMTVWRLVGKEILHRKLNFALGMLSVMAATGVVVAQFTLLRAHDLCTEQLLQANQDEASRRLAKMVDDYRKYMKDLGFNLLILPRGQDLAEFWQSGFASTTMPEDTVTTLANSGTVLIQHLLPIVQQSIFWPEQKRNITLMGTRGEVPLAHRKPMEPMLLAVPLGKCVVGHELAQVLDIKPGQTITLRGTDFEVQQIRPRRGRADDSTIWVDLAAGQKLLGMERRINAIEALKCDGPTCKVVTAEQMRQEVAGILGNQVQVVLRENEVTVRANARARAETEHEQAMTAQRASRAELRSRRESLAGVMVPAVLVLAAVWIGLLALSNVRERAAEIGILRAIGVRARAVVRVFFTRAIIMGLLGAAIGYAGGLTVAVLVERSSPSLRVDSAAALFEPRLLAIVLVAAPLLAMLASWAPAMLAGRQDPAVTLARE